MKKRHELLTRFLTWISSLIKFTMSWHAQEVFKAATFQLLKATTYSFDLICTWMIELIGCRAAEFVTLQEWGFHEPQNIKDKSESHVISPQKNIKKHRSRNTCKAWTSYNPPQVHSVPPVPSVHSFTRPGHRCSNLRAVDGLRSTGCWLGIGSQRSEGGAAALRVFF